MTRSLLSSLIHRRSSPTLYLVGRARTTIAFVVGCFRAGGGGARALLPMGEEDEGSSFFLPFGGGGRRSALGFPFLTGGCVWVTASA